MRCLKAKDVFRSLETKATVCACDKNVAAFERSHGQSWSFEKLAVQKLLDTRHDGKQNLFGSRGVQIADFLLLGIIEVIEEDDNPYI